MKSVILLTLDATRKDALGIYGNTTGLTPTIDTLKDNSLIFTNAQSTGPYTQAAFPGLLTSSYFLEYGQPKELSKKRTLISEALKNAGITTAGFHSNPYLSEYFGWNRSWDVFYDSMQDEVEPRVPYVRGHIVNQKAINWLSYYHKSASQKPFFLWLHYMDVHEPYMPDRKFVDMVYPSLDMEQDEMYALFRNVLSKRDVSDPDKVTLLKKLYNIHIREIDTYVEELLDHLKALGIHDNAVLIIASDHGDEFNEHGGLSHDDKMYSELIDMPLIIHGAGTTGVCDTVVSNIDIPPTILHLFGLGPAEGFKGQSLLPVASYQDRGVYGEAIHQHGKKGGDIDRDIYYYRTGNLKIIYRANTDEWEMYNLRDDPGETSNIISTSPKAAEMKEKLMPRVRRWLR